MVKRYFRPFICAVCAAISVLLGGGNLPMYIAAAELPVAEDGAQSSAETGTEAVTEAPETAPATETEAPQTEAPTEAPAPETAAPETAAPETQAQPVEQMANETAAPIAADTPMETSETGDGEDETGNGESETGGKEQDSTETENQTEAAKDTPAVLAFEKQSYGLGDEVGITIDKYVDLSATSSYLEFDIPKCMVFKEIGNKPVFKDRTAKIMYKDANNEWKEYTEDVKAEDIKGIRVQIDAEAGKTGIVQEDKLLVKLTAVNRVDDNILLTTRATHEGTDVTATTTARAHIVGDVADVVMTQDPEAPTQGSEVKQTTDVTYKMDADTMLTYTVDAGVDLLGLTFDEDGIFIGGNAVITSSTGDTQVEITKDLDLKSYSGITAVKLMPKEKAEKGVKNTFTATLSIREYMDAYTNKLSIVAGPTDNQVTSEYSQTFTIDFNTMGKPVLTYDGGMVPFEEDCVIGFGGMEIHSFKDIKSLEYTLSTPEFATIHEIQLPELTGASSIAVFAQAGEEEASVGEFKPGDVVTIDLDGISGFRFVFTLDGNEMTVTKDGSIMLASLNKKNRVNYFAFRATMKAVTEDTEKTSVSDILAVTFGLYQKPEQEDPRDPPNSPQQPTNPPAPELPPAPSDEPSDYDKSKEEEEEKKQSIIDKTLETDKATKEKQKELLAKRIASIRSSAVIAAGDTDGETSETSTADAFKDWLVKPIDESLVENLIPADINPINEDIVENLIPSEI